MDAELKERYYQVFRTTNALTKVEYADVVSIMDKIGLDDKTCDEFIKKIDAWTEQYAQKFKQQQKQLQGDQLQQALLQLQEDAKTARPRLPKETEDVFQRNMLEAIMNAADLQLLNTL